jgi:hypothetical protein
LRSARLASGAWRLRTAPAFDRVDRDLAPCLERLGGRHVLAGDEGRELFVPRYLKEFGYDRAATSVPGPA